MLCINQKSGKHKNASAAKFSKALKNIEYEQILKLDFKENLNLLVK